MVITLRFRAAGTSEEPGTTTVLTVRPSDYKYNNNNIDIISITITITINNMRREDAFI